MILCCALVCVCWFSASVSGWLLLLFQCMAGPQELGSGVQHQTCGSSAYNPCTRPASTSPLRVMVSCSCTQAACQALRIRLSHLTQYLMGQWQVTDVAVRRWRRYQCLAAEASRAESVAAPDSHCRHAPAAGPGRAEPSAAPDGQNRPRRPACAPSASKRRRAERCRLCDDGAAASGDGAPCEVHDTVGAVCVGPGGAAPKLLRIVGCPAAHVVPSERPVILPA